MADIKLRDRDTLRDAERSTALIALVSDDTNAGVTRKYTLAELNEALADISTPRFTWEKTTIFSGDAEPEEGNAERTFSTTVHNLDFKSGGSGPRHDFTEDYIFFNIGVVKFARNATSVDSQDRTWSPINSFPAISLLDATETSPLVFPPTIPTFNENQPTYSIALAKITDTSFKVVGIQTDHQGVNTVTVPSIHISKIEGLKLTIT